MNGVKMKIIVNTTVKREELMRFHKWMIQNRRDDLQT